MECKFFVGQKVVCIDDAPFRCLGVERPCGVCVGEVYTITGIVPVLDRVGLLLAELPHWYNPSGHDFCRFRPIHETQIEDLKRVARKAFDDAKTGQRDLVPTGAVR